MNLVVFLMFGGGVLALVGGAEIFVRGSSRLAVLIGVSPLVIGLTVVAFGTSAPETAVCVQSAWSGASNLAIGNVVGSNICNVLLILGLSAAITPMLVQQRVVRLDVPIMVGVSFVMLGMALDGKISRIDGAVLFAGSILYVSFLIVQSRRETKAVREEYEDQFGDIPKNRLKAWFVNTVLIVAGIALIVLGARWLVQSATAIATALGVSRLVIGLTVVAFGTSLPEIATSLVASLRGERDIAVGNIVGSNVFNILVVLGSSAAVSPGGITVSPQALGFDIPVMIAVAVACLPITFIGYAIHRWEGCLFLGFYAAYLAALTLEATGHQLLPLYQSVMILFVIPLVTVTLAVLSYRSYKSGRKSLRS